VLPRVLDFIDKSDRVFLFQEFIWGHDSAYNEASGKTNTEYYSRYLDSIVTHLRERHLEDETLIVLTSDHGFRDRALQSQPSVYHLPLLFHSTRFEPREDARLFSHIDFKDLLHGELGLGSSSVVEAPFVMVVGPTTSKRLAVLTKDEEFMLFETRGQRRFLLRHTISGVRTGTDPGDFLRLFDDYRTSFDASGSE
jgi:Type I phosphodiesterase / nucleotide pyrophosphatase